MVYPFIDPVVKEKVSFFVSKNKICFECPLLFLVLKGSFIDLLKFWNIEASLQGCSCESAYYLCVCSCFRLSLLMINISNPPY